MLRASVSQQVERRRQGLAREITVCGQCLVAAAGVHQLRELIASLANVQRKYIAEG